LEPDSGFKRHLGVEQRAAGRHGGDVAQSWNHQYGHVRQRERRVRRAWRDGDAIQHGNSDGDAIQHGNSDGDAIQHGNSDGDAIQHGNSDGDATTNEHHSTTGHQYGAGAARDEYGAGAARDEYGTGAARDEYGAGAARDEYGTGAARDEYGTGAARRRRVERYRERACGEWQRTILVRGRC